MTRTLCTLILTLPLGSVRDAPAAGAADAVVWKHYRWLPAEKKMIVRRSYDTSAECHRAADLMYTEMFESCIAEKKKTRRACVALAAKFAGACTPERLP
jgi:hypothetical protein